jgi:hypothetical protein
MPRFLNWLAGSLSRPEPRPRRATRAGRRPALEMLESRLLPTVSMYPVRMGPPGQQSVVEEIRVDSAPTAIAFAQVGGTIMVSANTDIVDSDWTNTRVFRPGDGPATIDASLAGIQRVEIHEEWGNNIVAIIATLDPVTIFSGARDRITVGDGTGNVLGIGGTVDVVGSAGGTSLTVNDQGDAAPHTVNLDGGSITGLAPAAITYAPSQVSSLTVQLGGGADTVNVAGTSVPTSVVCGASATINVGNGSVLGIGGALNIVAGAGHPTINVNDQNDPGAPDVSLRTVTGDGSTSTITGLSPAPITFDNTRTAAVNLDLPGGSSLTLDGSNDPTSRTVNVDEDFSGRFGYDAGEIAGLIPATITYPLVTVALVTLHTGTGNETVNVLEEGGLHNKPMTLVGHSSHTTVNVGNYGSGAGNGNALGILGALTVTNAVAGGTTLNIDDGADAFNHLITLDTRQAPGVPWLYGTVTGLAPASISYRTGAVGGLAIKVGTGCITFDVLAAAVPVRLAGNATNTTVNVGQGSTARISASLGITGETALTLDDSTDPVSRTITLTQQQYVNANRNLVTLGEIFGLAPGAITYDPASLGQFYLGTGTGTETVNVNALAVRSTWMVAHSNSTVFDLGSGGTVRSIHTTLQVRGGGMPNGAWASPRVVVDDSADTSPQAIAVTPQFLPNVPPYSNFNFLPFGAAVPYDLLTGFAGLTVWVPALWDTAALTVKTGLGGATVTAVVLGPTTLVGSPSASNTLNAGSGGWNLTGHNAGSLGPLSFSGFGSVNAGGGSTFAFQGGASLSGTLRVGGANNTLDYTNYGGDVVVNLQTGHATGAGALAGAFGTVIGASGGGGPGVYNILVGNGGILKGGNGRRNLLIAGPGKATLLGGDGEDILIAGTTAYDLEATSARLIAIMSEWTRTDESYATRVTRLTRGLGVPYLTAQTVRGNHAGNTLTGGAGLDWFFARPGSDQTDRAFSESLVSL